MTKPADYASRLVIVEIEQDLQFLLSNLSSECLRVQILLDFCCQSAGKGDYRQILSLMWTDCYGSAMEI